MMSKLVDLVCGYGEKPLSVVKFSLVFVLICAFVYFARGINQSNQSMALSSDASFKANISHVFNCLYFCIVTFTTLGYGDLTPVGFTRAVAAFEVFIGSFTMALFVVVFVKKTTRS